MSRNRIFAKEINLPEVRDALQVHTAERDALLSRLLESLGGDERVRAAWLWGSFLRGEEDDLSDLDIWILVSDRYATEMAAALRGYCTEAGTVVTAGENPRNGPAGGGYLGVLMAGTHGLHHLDIYWQPASQGEMPGGAVLLNRLEAAEPTFPSQTDPMVPPDATPLSESRDRIAFIWLMLSVTAKYLARDPDSDMQLLSYPRNSYCEAIALLGLEGEVSGGAWDIPERAIDKVDLLRSVAKNTAVLEEVCRAQSLEISTHATPCLLNYLDLVGSIISAS